MQTILIADRSEQFCRTLQNKLDKIYAVEVCHSGYEVLEQFHVYCPSLLVLDMELPGMDGMNLLRMIHDMGNKTHVIALSSCTGSSYLAGMVASYGVDYLVFKPCTANAVISNIKAVLKHYEQKPYLVSEDIECRLLSLGFREDMVGYPCMVEAVRIFSLDDTKQITKNIYPEVAAICGGSSKRIERAIRSLIHDAWERRNEPEWSVYFPPTKNIQKPPSNGRAIVRLANCLRSRKLNEL